MIHNSTPHSIFKISELTRSIAGQLVLISRKSAVNLACSSRYLEEPVLSALWETQSSLFTLLELLPEHTWCIEEEDNGWCGTFRIMADPSQGDWNRVQRFASWMRQADLDERLFLEEATLSKLRLNSPPGGWFPALHKLRWTIAEPNLPFADLFFSPRLRKVFISTTLVVGAEVPRDIRPAVASAISTLPTSTLRSLLVDFRYLKGPWAPFRDSFSSIVLRCGPSLTKFASPIPLSEAAINHLIHLPHLRSWRIDDPPPNYSTLPLPLGFPPLTEFKHGGDAARGWISLFGRLATGVSHAQGMTPLFKTRESMKCLSIINYPSPVIDASFVSPIRIFRNLGHLNVVGRCSYEDIDGQCVFKLNNDDVIELAMALSQLEFLRLGHPCSKNTCATTAACLLPISVYCVELEMLEIHINTVDIVGDLKGISEDPHFQELRSLPRSKLSRFEPRLTPLSLDEHGFETVVNGMIDLFPSLEWCEGYGGVWDEVSERINELRRTRTFPRCCR